MKKLATCILFAIAAVRGIAQTAPTNSCANVTLGPLGGLNGFVPSPQDAWHQDISQAPLDPNSAKIMTTSGDLANRYLHPDFSSIAGGGYGIPYTVVDTSLIPSVPVPIILYPADSDISLFPLTPDQPIEGSPGACPADGNDRHAIVLDKNKCVVYELYQASYCNGQWTASGSTIWDMSTVEQRPYGLSSTDAAGLSVFEGLLRYDEIVAGAVNHAIRFTANHTKNDANNGYFTAPATHAAGSLWGTDNIMGMRIRLRADFDISGFSQTNQIILKAMKQYGMILADNGSDMFFQGTPDARWDDNDLGALKNVPSSAFDVVQMAPVYDSATAPTGQAPLITSFAASATTVPPGTSVTLTSAVTEGSYSFIDNAGFTRGSVTVSPAATTTYTLTSRNAFGSSTAAVTVTVDANAPAPTPPPTPTPAPPTPPPPPPPPAPTVLSITVVHPPKTVQYALKATATMSDGSKVDITQTAVWTSSDPAVGGVAAGQLSFTSAGTTEITAQSGSVTSAPVAVKATAVRYK